MLMLPKACHSSDIACSHHTLVKALSFDVFIMVSFIEFDMLSHPGFFVFIEK